MPTIHKQFGLIGHTLKHSFSENYFTEKFKKEAIKNTNYALYELESIDAFPKLVEETKNITGFNVTIPYKEQVIPFLDELDPAAEEIGAVNTIKIIGKKLIGFNSDAYGFENSLKPLLNSNEKYKALILGTGGASKAIAYVLKKLNIPFYKVSRQENAEYLNYNQLDDSIIKDHKIIINTTPLGTYPNNDSLPSIPYDAIGSSHILYDLVYNPAETLFLKKGLLKGAKTKNGYQMLVLQAEKSWEVWNQ